MWCPHNSVALFKTNVDLMAEVVAAIGAAASVIQLVDTISKGRAWIWDLAKTTKSFQYQAKALLDLAESSRLQYAGHLDEQFWDMYVTECKAFYKTAQELHVDSKRGCRLANWLRKAYMWKVRKCGLNESLKRLSTYVMVVTQLGVTRPQSSELMQALRMTAQLKMHGRYTSSLEYAEKAEVLSVAAHGTDATETLKAQSQIAEIIGLSGNLNKAERAWRRLLDTRNRVYGAKDLDTIATISNLAIVLHAQGNFEEAEVRYRDALALHQEIQGTDEALMKTKHNLAITLQDQKKYQEAEDLYEVVLAWKRAKLGSTDVSTLSTINNLGALYQLQEEWGDAWKMYEEAFIGRTKLLGSTHPNTIRTRLNMAAILEAQGQYAEAEFMARGAFELYIDRLGTDNSDTISAMRLLARILHLLERYEDSESMSRAAFMASRNLLGPEHKDTLALQSQADQLRDWIRECEDCG